MARGAHTFPLELEQSYSTPFTRKAAFPSFGISLAIDAARARAGWEAVGSWLETNMANTCNTQIFDTISKEKTREYPNHAAFLSTEFPAILLLLFPSEMARLVGLAHTCATDASQQASVGLVRLVSTGSAPLPRRQSPQAPLAPRPPRPPPPTHAEVRHAHPRSASIGRSAW